VSDAIFATIDLMPTFANLAGFKVPEDRTIDGVDQTNLLLGKSEQGARDNFLYLDNAVRQGKWKYLRAKHKVFGYARDRERKLVEELYDLETDIGERNNLAARHPEKVTELKRLMKTLAKEKQQAAD
jgi:arylsulfatase A-like enzyme